MPPHAAPTALATLANLATRLLLLLPLAALVLSMVCPEVTRAAPAGDGLLSLTAACTNDDELLDLCQRCAKLTRSPLALDACCSRDLLARSFCNDYVYFARSRHDAY